MTWLASDYDGWFNFAELLRCATSSKDGARDFFGYYLDDDGYVCRWSNEAKSACGGGTAIRWEP